MHEIDTSSTDRRRRRRRRGILVLLLSLAVASLGAGAFSLALFTDTDASSQSFTAGTIDIESSPTTLFTVTAMMPGDTGSETLTVQNNGSGQLRYSMTSSSTDADGLGLRDQLDFTITAGTCPGAGLPLFDGVLSAAAFGDVTVGPDSGDRVLDASTSEDLCFAWSLPDTTDNTYQGATTTATFTFEAEQTANNP